MSAATATVWLKRNKETLGELSVDSETGVCMTGLLLMADFSRAFQLPLHFSGPLTKDKKNKQAPLLLNCRLLKIFYKVKLQ